jgi:hypothetical protein
MTWRKWLVRGLVFSVVSGTLLSAVAYHRWTNPDSVRQQVLDRLAAEFTGATVTLESAHLRLLGGISVSELRFTRRGDADRADFLYIPSAVIYHDKEHLLDGHLKILKLVLDRPRLHVIRSADGTWNLADVLSPHHEERIPTIVVKQGTILLEDRQAPGRLPIEIRDVNLTATNDPVTTVLFAGSGSTEMAGPLRASGTWVRASNDTAVSVEASAIPVGPALFQRLAPYAQQLASREWQLEGKGRLQAELTYRPTSAPCWSHNVHLQLTQGHLSDARLPWPMENLTASLHCRNGQLSLDSCTASSGPTRLEMSFQDLNPEFRESSWEACCRKLDVKVDHLVVAPSLWARLPESCQQLQRDFSPEGVANVTCEVRRDANGQWVKHCVLEATDGSASVMEFPYRLEHITGTIVQDMTSAGQDEIKVNLVGHTGSCPIYIRGDVTGQRPRHRVDLKIWGDDIPLDEKLEDALEKGPGLEYRKLAESFKPRELAQAHQPMGLGDFQSVIRRDPEAQRFSNWHTVRFHDATVRYAEFPYLLQNVTGVLEIQPGGRWEFHDSRGVHQGGEFRVSGRKDPERGAGVVTIQMAGSNILLDGELRDALQPELQKSWDTLAPGGRIDFTGKLTFPPCMPRAAGSEVAPRPEIFPEIELTLYPHDCSIKPRFFDCQFQELQGSVHYAKRWLTLERVRARHGASQLTLGTSYIFIRPNGGFYAELNDLEGNPLFPDEELLKALPGAVGTACRFLELRDPFAFHTHLVVDAPQADGKPVLYWDGSLALRDAHVRAGVAMEHVTGQMACRGRHNGERIEGVIGNLLLSEAKILDQPCHDVRAQLVITPDAPDVLRLHELWMHYAGGEVYGPVRVEFGPTVRYEAKLTATGVKLEEFGRSNFGSAARMSGLATASLYVSGQGTDLNNLRGGGTIDVPHGKIEELPPLVPLLKVLGLRAPDRTAFDEAHASFDIQGQRLVVNRLDLFGDVISLRGLGSLKLDGTDLDLDFHVDWARFNQVLPGGIKKIPPAISDQLLKIKMRGRLGDAQATKELLPEVVGPIREKLQEMRPSPTKGPSN